MPSTSQLPSEIIDAPRVRRLFASPERVAASGFLRREISSRMQERLDLVALTPQAVLDAGCGEGDDLSVLQRRYQGAQMICVDASSAMLAAASASHDKAKSALKRLIGKWLPAKDSAGPHLLCSDIADIPLPNNAVDLLWSNLALHWHPQPQAVFAEWRRVLRVDGLMMFTCFGPDTFKELRQAFAAVDDHAHVLPFIDMHDFGDMLLDAGFSTPVMDMEMITVTYDSVDALISDARAFGGNPLLVRSRGLLGRKRGERVRQALEAMRRADGKIPLSFEVIYGHAFKPAPTMTEQGEAIMRFMPRK